MTFSISQTTTTTTKLTVVLFFICSCFFLVSLFYKSVEKYIYLCTDVKRKLESQKRKSSKVQIPKKAPTYVFALKKHRERFLMIPILMIINNKHSRVPSEKRGNTYCYSL